MTHTPGKLRVVTERTRPNQGFAIRGEGAALIAETVEDHETVNGQANAERLAHCWNCHDELVRALEELVFVMEPMESPSMTTPFKKARAAIAAAKNEEVK